MKEEDVLKEYEFYRNQLETLQQNLNLVDNSLVELRMVSKSLSEIGAAKKESEVFVPIGFDSFIKAKITDPDNVVVGIGAGVAAKKTIKEAKDDFEERIKELETVKADNTSNLESVISKLREIEPSVKSIVAQSQSGKKEG
ncbi:prefoldin subunit alpha [archaeon]|nr:prefoldin subunit alpha [archaeon]